jgi:hypothetical protein
MLRAVFREGNPLTAGLNRRVAKDWLEWFSICPRRRIDRLAVIVSIENRCALRSTRRVAFFWMFGVSLAMFGIERNSLSSRMMRSSLSTR